MIKLGDLIIQSETPGNFINIEKPLFPNVLEFEEYYLIKNNQCFKISIFRRNNDILIKSNSYEICLNKNDLSLLTKSLFDSNTSAYLYIINIFENQNCLIKEIFPKQAMNLLMKIYIYNEEKYVEISMIYNNKKRII